MDLTKKNVLVVGAGISGFGAAETLKKHGADVRLYDAKPDADLSDDARAHIAALRDMGVGCIFGEQSIDSLLDATDTLVLSPAVPMRIPLVEEALHRGLGVSSEVELAGVLARDKGIMLAVTGTNGKTTTTTLLGELLKTKFAEVGVGGNLGVALSLIADNIGANSAIAAEISSYQMEATNFFAPEVACILNLTPDHQARHGSMAVYQQMKEKIFLQQTADDILVLNYDDVVVREMKNRAKGKVCYFSRKSALTEGVMQIGDALIIRWGGKEQFLIKVSELGIKGGHNIENALAASAMAFLVGTDVAKMREVLRSFAGVEHRIEPVRTLNGISYYNDSKATNTDSAIKALETFDEGIVLIAGGDDKGTDLTEFMIIVKDKVCELILVGDAADRFNQAALTNGYAEQNIHRAGYDMGTAVRLAYKLAGKNKNAKVVLLSPACASFDMYSGFEERGRDFKRLVQELE